MNVIAIPKPSKLDRKRANVEWSDLALPKEGFYRNGVYRSWVNSHRCLLWWWREVPCRGNVEAAHLQRGGKAIKGSDASCIPLCGLAHHPLLDGNSLDFEVIAFLWMKAWELREEWHRRTL